MELKLPYPPIAENAAVHAAIAVNAAWEISRVDLDYSVQSLNRVDEILEEFRRRGTPVASVTGTLCNFGCYVGEVFVRHAQGSWVDLEHSPMTGAGSQYIVIELPAQLFCNPIGKVFKRLENGEEDSVAYFYKVFAERAQAGKPWWKRWGRGE